MGGRVKVSTQEMPRFIQNGHVRAQALARKRQALGKCGGADNKVHSLILVPHRDWPASLIGLIARLFMVGLFAAPIKILNQASPIAVWCK
jgi:hypothetical protein